MEQQLKEFLHLKELRDKALKELLPLLYDSNIDIKERWEVYLEIEQDLPVYSDVANPVDSLLPKDHTDGDRRYSERLFVDFAEDLDFEEDEDFFEAVLSSGHRGFVYDW